jgi:cation/acetate symporter
MSAASFLGIVGLVSLVGIDGWWLGLGFFAGWMVVLLVIAGPLKKSGRFTVGDVLASRFAGGSVKLMAMIATIVIGVLYLVPQIVGAGHLFRILLGWDFMTTVLLTGAFIALMVVLGGMRGTTINQAIQGALLWSAMILMFVLGTILYFGGNPFGPIAWGLDAVPPVVALPAARDLLAAAPVDGFAFAERVRTENPHLATALTPGIAVGDLTNQLSLVVGLVLGTAGLPHILIRFYTVKDVRAAQKSCEFTIVGLAAFYLATLFVGLITMAVLYPVLLDYLARGQRGVATNMALPMLGIEIGGEVVLGIIAAGAMAAMLSTAVGLLMSMTTSLAHDFYAGILRPQSSEKERVLFAKIGAALFTVVSIILSVWLRDQNVAILVAMCFGIAGSTVGAALLLAVWWKGLTRQGVVAGLAVGLVSSLVFTFARFADVPQILGVPVLVNPALYSIPLAYVTMFVVSRLTKVTAQEERQAAEFLALAHRP